MMTTLATYLGCALLLLGATFSLIAAIGVVRLPDLLTRMHAASKAGAVGGGLVLLSAALLCFDFGVIVRSITGVIFLLITTPVGAHLLAKASYRVEEIPQKNLIVDEIRPKYH